MINLLESINYTLKYQEISKIYQIYNECLINYSNENKLVFESYDNKIDDFESFLIEYYSENDLDVSIKNQILIECLLESKLSDRGISVSTPNKTNGRRNIQDLLQRKYSVTKQPKSTDSQPNIISGIRKHLPNIVNKQIDNSVDYIQNKKDPNYKDKKEQVDKLNISTGYKKHIYNSKFGKKSTEEVNSIRDKNRKVRQANISLNNTSGLINKLQNLDNISKKHDVSKTDILKQHYKDKAKKFINNHFGNDNQNKNDFFQSGNKQIESKDKSPSRLSSVLKSQTGSKLIAKGITKSIATGAKTTSGLFVPAHIKPLVDRGIDATEHGISKAVNLGITKFHQFKKQKEK